MRQLSPGKLWGLRRMADGSGRFKMVAVDQRPPIKNPIAEHYGTREAPYEDVARFKRLLIETLQASSSAMLLDPHYAIPGGIDALPAARGLVVTLEDSLFEGSPGGRRSAAIDHWSVAKIKRMGADAVKVLAWYRPDAEPSVRQHQQDFVRSVGEACARHDIPFLLELLVYPLGDGANGNDYLEMPDKKADHVLASVEEFAAPGYGIDVFKLESPINADRVPGVGNEGWQDAQARFDALGEVAGRPWVMLSAGAGKTAFRAILSHAYRAGASGYLAGRAIWLDAFGEFPDWDAMRAALHGASVDYMANINALTDAEAPAWHSHPSYGEGGVALAPDGAAFRQSYGEV